MARNPLLQLFQPRQGAGVLQPSPEQQLSDALIAEIASGDPTAQRRLNTYLDEQPEAPFADQYEGMEEAIGASNIYGDPRVRQMREEQQAFELEKATAPARMQGMYGVRAAEAKGQAQYDALQEMLRMGGQPGQRVSVSGVGSISQPQPSRREAPSTIANRQYLQSLRTGKAQAQRPAGESWFERLFSGPTQSELNRQEIARIEQLLAGDIAPASDADMAPVENDTVTLVAPSGATRTVSRTEAQRYLTANPNIRIVE